MLVLFAVLGFFIVSSEINKKAERKAHRENTTTTIITIDEKLQKYPGALRVDGQETWAIANTTEWVIFNGFLAAQDCPPLLEVMHANPHMRMFSPQAAMLLTNNTELQTIKLLVPSFKSKPRAVDECVGLAYDEKSGHLVNGHLKVAFLVK